MMPEIILVVLALVDTRMQPTLQADQADRRSVTQLKRIAAEIRKCPVSEKLGTDGSGYRAYSPINVVWNMHKSDSSRSPEIAVIEFIQHLDYIARPLETCKERDKACHTRNQAVKQFNVIMMGVSPPSVYRYEFDSSDGGLELVRRLAKHENEDETRWTAQSAIQSCPESAISRVLNEPLN